MYACIDFPSPPMQPAMSSSSLKYFQAIALLTAALLSLIFLFNLFREGTKKGKNKDPPEPSGALPIIGHLHVMGGGDQPMVRKFGAMADKYGPAFVLRLGSRPALIISCWELAKECFTTNDKVLAGRPRSEAGIQMGYKNAMLGFHPHDAYWRSMRKLTMLELLSSQRLDSLKHIRVKEVDLIMKDLYELWEKNGRMPVTVEMSEKFGDITFNVIAMMVIGKRCFGSLGDDNGEAFKFRDSIQKWFHLFGAFVPSDLFPCLRWFDIRGYKKEMRKLFKGMDLLLSKWVEEHRARKKCGGGDHRDFLDVLISTVDGSDISDYDPDTIIKATILTVMLGGYDTAWITNTWTLSLLLNHGDKLRKAQEEIDKHVGKDRNVEESDVANLPYLQAIVKETLRLYPPAPLSGPHEATEDCCVGGYHIRAGTRLLVNLWKMHRDPRIWSEPDKFIPERFLTEHAEIDAKGKNFEYLPFGSGRRICPGISMAFQILHLALARLLHGFEMKTPDEEPVDMTEGIGMTVPKETPLQVVLSPRLPLQLYK